MSQPTYLDSDAVYARITRADAVHALRQALIDGFDPHTDIPRTIENVPAGQILTMPAALGDAAGLKLLTLAPGNPEQDLPLIQGMYVLFDGSTLTPTHLLDGEAITDIRTPAVSIAAVWDALTASSEPVRAVCYGAGHQGVGHAQTLRDALAGHRDVESVTAIVRTPEKVAGNATVQSSFDDILAADSDAGRDALRAANVIMCTTTSTTPLFRGSDVADDAIVMAVGSHTATARELDGSLMRRADVIVEDVDTALDECGDVILALKEGMVLVDELIPMSEVVTGRRRPRPGRPVVFKSSGMSWEDLVIARAVAAA